MSTYSIKDLEQLSGIKAHTLRIWEQRYNFIHPKRTDTNIRFYDDVDLKLVLNVALLNQNGYKISKIASMGEQDISEEVLKLTQKDLKYGEQIHALTIAMVELDESKFEKIISTNILKIGLENTMSQIIYPFLSRTGILWQTGAINPAQEHFMSNLIRQKIIVAIDGQEVAPNTSSKFMLFLPEGELHEVSLLFANYLIRSRGSKVIYLGQSLPFADLITAHKIHKPEYLLTFITTSPSQAEIQKYIFALSDTFKDTKIIISGYQVIGQDLDLPQNIIPFSNLHQLTELAEQLSDSLA